MLPDRVSNPRPLTYESGAVPIALYAVVTRGLSVRGSKMTKAAVTGFEVTGTEIVWGRLNKRAKLLLAKVSIDHRPTTWKNSYLELLSL